MKFMKSRPVLIALLAIAVLIVLALSTGGERTATFVESAVGAIAQPVQTFASNASRAIMGFFSGIFKTTDADKENQQLKLYIAQLEQDLNEIDTLRQENRRLKDLLAFAEASAVPESVTATVIGKNQGIWFDVFTVNAGRNRGIEKNMAVISAKGLVGRVTEVGATYCKVTALIDAGFNASVMVERTREIGMVRGLLDAGSDSDMLDLYYLKSSSDLVPGDVIVTSGLGGIYPKNIPVGAVVEVTRYSENVDRNATVKPAVDFSKLEEVMIITGMVEPEE